MDERFAGFPPEALAFFAGLRIDNSRAYWERHKATWERTARDPMRALLASLPDRFGPFRLFRPYRDVRFSRDKSPYKTQIAAAGEGEGGTTFYVQLSDEGLFVAAGYYHLAPDQLARFREAVAGPAGERLVDLARSVEAAGFTVAGGAEPDLKRVPRGWPPDHPRVEWLKRKGVTLAHPVGDPPWLHAPEARERIVAAWDAAAPVTDWLDRHVGPSRELPPEIRALLGG